MAKCSICLEEVQRYEVVFTPKKTVIRCPKHKESGASYQPFKKYWDTNIAEKPVLIESDRHRERLMKEGGLSVRPREHIDDLNQRRWKLGMPPLEE